MSELTLKHYKETNFQPIHIFFSTDKLDSSFLQNLISNIEMTVVKSDLIISKMYVDQLLEDDCKYLFKEITKESKKVKKAIKLVTSNDDLLEDNPILKNTLKVRNTYLDPLSLIQILLMKKI